MQISQLSLTNFRNYGRLEIVLPAGPVLLHGANAQGKTNFLEAIAYLATTRSPHADQDQQLLNWSAAESGDPLVAGRLVAQVTTESAERQLELRLIQERQGDRISFRREALVNRRKVRLMDMLGQLRVVVFLPQDIQLITGSPAARRRYLDITLCQTDPVYCRALSDYNKLLEQRNALLRQIAESGTGRDLLPVFTDRLGPPGAEILTRRARLLADLARAAQRIHYESLTDRQETIRLRYLPRLDRHRTRADARREAAPRPEATAVWLATATPAETAPKLLAALANHEAADIAQGRTGLGPHRDDWRFWVDGRDLSRFGSRGQQRSALLALKLAEIDWITGQTGESPVLLLDEVVAELDERRRSLLLDFVLQAPQAILTATDLAMFSDRFRQQARAIEVRQGQLHPAQQAPS